MTPEQRFARWVRLAMATFALLFVYFITADLLMPLTPQARAIRQVSEVAPELSGRVVEVAVHNNSRVEKGDVLFRLDPEPYRIALNRAKLALEEVELDNARLDASLAAAKAELAAARANARELVRERQRVESLVQKHTVSQQQRDQIVAKHEAASARVEAAQAKIRGLQLERGEAGQHNLKLRQARNQIADAELNLRRTTVRAGQNGVVSNLQLESGDYASAGGAVLAVVGEQVDITADFREKSLRHLGPGDTALVSFDAWPGRVFSARAAGVDAGVSDGQQAANGQLASIPTTDRWVRDAQRLRLHLRLDSAPSSLPPSGARVTVQLVPGDHPIAALFARMQIRLISWMHYVY